MEQQHIWFQFQWQFQFYDPPGKQNIYMWTVQDRNETANSIMMGLSYGIVNLKL